MWMSWSESKAKECKTGCNSLLHYQLPTEGKKCHGLGITLIGNSLWV